MSEVSMFTWSAVGMGVIIWYFATFFRRRIH